MKKISLFISLLISLSVCAEIPCDVYLMGTVNGWQPKEKFKFRKTSDPDVAYLSLSHIEGEFKIANSDWNVINYGGCDYLGDIQTVEVGEYKPVWCASNYRCEGLNDVTFVFDFHLSYAPVLYVVPTEEFNVTDYEFPDLSHLVNIPEDFDYGQMIRSGIFLMSHMHDSQWKENPRYEFRHVAGSEIYFLKVAMLYNDFKIATPDWIGIDFGKKDYDWYTNDEMGTYILTNKGYNFHPAPMLDALLTLDLTDKSNPKLTIAKDPEADTSWREGYQLVYADEFNGNKLNTDRWHVYTGEQAWTDAAIFTDRYENVHVRDGALHLVTRREEYGGKHFTTGSVSTLGGLVYRYGRIDIRMKQPPTANGLNGGLWLLGYHGAWPSCGEIDMIEFGHHDVHSIGTAHRMFYSGYFAGPFNSVMTKREIDWQQQTPFSIQDDEYHLYTYFWDKEKILCFIDLDKYPDEEPYWVLPINRDEPENPAFMSNYMHHPYYLIWTFAAQFQPPSVNTPEEVTALNDANNHRAEMAIDYLRLYQKGDPDEILVARVPSDHISPLSINDATEVDKESDCEPVYYNLTGSRVSADTSGVLIRVQGTKVSKIFKH